MRNRVFLFLAAFVAVAGAPASQAAPKSEPMKYLSAAAGNAEITGYVFRPKGDGPFPVVIGMHGCGGLFEGNGRAILDTRLDWADRFVKAGYVLVYPDSYKSRGVGSVCEIRQEKLPVKFIDQVGDLTGTINWLLTQPFVDRDRISMIGWGTGGSAVLRLLDPGLAVHKRVNFAAAVAYYPQCEYLLKSFGYTPRLLPVVHSGAADQLAPSAPCKDLSARWNSPFTAHAGAYHNFDAPNAPVRKRKYATGVVYVGTNKAARDKSIKDTMSVLSKGFAVAAAAAAAAREAVAKEKEAAAAKERDAAEQKEKEAALAKAGAEAAAKVAPETTPTAK